MSGWYGLIELVLVFGLVLGWAVWESYKTRTYRAPPVEPRDDEPA